MGELKRYRIDVPPAALADIDEIVDYLNTLSAETAVKHLYEINEGINSLQTLPLRCPPAKNDEYAKKGWHYLVVIYYLVFFTVEEDTVKIQRIVDGRKNYTNYN